MADLFWLSDAQWAVIEPFMPKDQPGPARKDDRQIISGILHVLTSGRRWRIEATFCRLKDFRRIATRYDKLACNDASAVALAAVIAFWC